MIQLSPETLRSKTITYDKLSMMQKIILNNGGSLTKLMEVILNENMKLCKHTEELLVAKRYIPFLGVNENESFLQRKITLQGEDTGTNYIYAHSYIATKHLGTDFYNALMKTQIPIGKIWELLKVETYKKIIAWGDEPAGSLGTHFNVPSTSRMLYRTYIVYSKKTPIMQITEKFPESLFKNFDRFFNGLRRQFKFSGDQSGLGQLGKRNPDIPFTP